MTKDEALSLKPGDKVKIVNIVENVHNKTNHRNGDILIVDDPPTLFTNGYFTVNTINRILYSLCYVEIYDAGHDRCLCDIRSLMITGCRCGGK